MPKSKHTETEYKQNRRLYRKMSARHVLVLEADMPEDMKRRTFGLSDELRICGNNLTAKLSRSLDQLFRTKKYRALQKAYGNLSERLEQHPHDKESAAELKAIAAQMSEMQKQYHVTWDDAYTYMIYLKDRAGFGSVFALTRAEDIWSGVGKVLFSGADNIHFKKRGCLPEIRAKQPNRGIVLSVKEGKLYFKCSDIGIFTYKQPDKFQSDEITAVLKYLESPGLNDEVAVNKMLETGEIADTFRPCYASLVCKKIRGRLRVYIHLTIEGKALPKFKSDGITPRHTFGKGRVGADIGTQTVAYTSYSEVGLKNLSERGMTISHAERQERLLLRKMDRSRRATNPDSYNSDGTVKKGFKVWKKSSRYKKIQRRHAELCRKNAESRKYAINGDANHLRSLGDEIVTEPANFKALQKKAKPTQNESSISKKNKRRKRFGKSLKNRSPGTFQAALKSRFESTGGSYHEVDKMYRASQYDHTADDYIKKKLSQRMFVLTGGSKVQRDWYSSFLLYNSNNHYSEPDKDECTATFDRLYKMQLDMIDDIKKAGIRVLNSGIAA